MEVLQKLLLKGPLRFSRENTTEIVPSDRDKIPHEGTADIRSDGSSKISPGNPTEIPPGDSPKILSEGFVCIPPEGSPEIPPEGFSVIPLEAILYPSLKITRGIASRDHDEISPKSFAMFHIRSKDFHKIPYENPSKILSKGSTNIPPLGSPAISPGGPP